MYLLGSILSVFVILKLSTCSPLPSSKEKPVDLKYSCMRVTSDENKNNDPPIILLHGLSSSKESWMGIYQVLALKTGREVCIADLRNHGESPRSESMGIEAMAEDVVHLIDTIGAKKVVLLGHSLGGKISVHVALNHPEKVEKLIVEDMRPNGVAPKALQEVLFLSKLLIGVIKQVPDGSTEREAKKFILDEFNKYLVMMNSTLVLDERFGELLPIRCSDGKCEWKTNLKLLETLVKDPESFLITSSGVYNGASLFIYGSESNFKVGDDEENIRKQFPNAKLVAVEGASHIVHDKPKFLDEVIKFINKND